MIVRGSFQKAVNRYRAVIDHSIDIASHLRVQLTPCWLPATAQKIFRFRAVTIRSSAFRAVELRVLAGIDDRDSAAQDDVKAVR